MTFLTEPFVQGLNRAIYLLVGDRCPVKVQYIADSGQIIYQASFESVGVLADSHLAPFSVRIPHIKPNNKVMLSEPRAFGLIHNVCKC